MAGHTWDTAGVTSDTSLGLKAKWQMHLVGGNRIGGNLWVILKSFVLDLFFRPRHKTDDFSCNLYFLIFPTPHL